MSAATSKADRDGRREAEQFFRLNTALLRGARALRLQAMERRADAADAAAQAEEEEAATAYNDADEIDDLAAALIDQLKGRTTKAGERS